MLPGLVSGENSLSGLQMVTFSLCPLMAFPVCMREREVGGGASGVSSSSYNIRLDSLSFGK